MPPTLHWLDVANWPAKIRPGRQNDRQRNPFPPRPLPHPPSEAVTGNCLLSSKLLADNHQAADAEPVNRPIQTHDPAGKLRPAWPADSTITAVFSECQRYRYQLREIWDASQPLVLWLLMNPSVACTEYSDPTLRRTGNFARTWGYGGQLIGNVHAYRATDKNRLLEVTDPVGPENDQMILAMAAEAKIIVLAYGQPPKALRARGQELVSRLRHHPNLSYLRLAQDGTPVHPLYLPSNLRPKPYRDLPSLTR